MKKQFLLVATLLLSVAAFGQEVKRCGTVDYIQQQEQMYPGYQQAVNATFESVKHANSPKSGETYRIPVVVHVVYNTDAKNLHDSVIHNQIQVLNDDYRRLNSDATNLRSVFLPYAGDANIEFVLAEYDPNGNPTTGITRTQTSKATFLNFASTSGMMGIEDVKSTATGGIDPWNQSRYLNIWVCDMSFSGMTFLLGYATPPANLPNWPAGSTDDLGDGVVLQYNIFGANNPAPMNTNGYVVAGRTATHEVGHYLGLRHIWGDGDCTQHDGIDDTPNAVDQSNSDCDTTKNTCTDDNIDGQDLPDMVENFMDYSAETCQNTFTKGQVSLMRGVLEGPRWDLINNNPALSVPSLSEMKVSMYPNPTNHSVSIVCDESVVSSIQLVDLNGKLLKQVNVMGEMTTLSLDGLSNGVYQVILSGATQIKQLKLIKQ